MIYICLLIGDPDHYWATRPLDPWFFSFFSLLRVNTTRGNPTCRYVCQLVTERPRLRHSSGSEPLPRSQARAAPCLGPIERDAFQNGVRNPTEHGPHETFGDRLLGLHAIAERARPTRGAHMGEPIRAKDFPRSSAAPKIFLTRPSALVSAPSARPGWPSRHFPAPDVLSVPNQPTYETKTRS